MGTESFSGSVIALPTSHPLILEDYPENLRERGFQAEVMWEEKTPAGMSPFSRPGALAETESLVRQVEVF